MKRIDIPTCLGNIAVFQKVGATDKTPLLLLHGVYFDHHLWDFQIGEINERTVLAVDMPLHGESRCIASGGWTMNDCAIMLIEILDHLHINQVIAVGHSWGSMTILRAAHRNPERFASIGLCNMPLHAAKPVQKILFALQHLMLPFRSFYRKKAAEALFGKKSLEKNPGLYGELERSMRLLSNKEIKHIDKVVITDAIDGTVFLKKINRKTMSLKGVEDYVPNPPGIDVVLVEGGHISPLESPEEVSRFIKRIIDYF